MSATVSQITSLTIVYSNVYSGADHRKHESSVSLAFVRGIHRWPVNSPHKGPVTRKKFPFDDVIMQHLALPRQSFLWDALLIHASLWWWGHFADDIFRCIFLNENVWISSKISLTFVHKILINNIPALIQVMAWRRPCYKPLSEPMMVSLLTHICITRL